LLFGTNAERGLSGTFSELGHYGGFFDPVVGSSATEHLCHDCCVLLFRALPGFHRKMLGPSAGAHFVEYKDGPCCDDAYSYSKSDFGTMLHASAYGEWGAGIIIYD
jgi:hypothetical protein